MSKRHTLSQEWLLPQLICMTFGETLFTMTGIAFSFTEVNITDDKSKIFYILKLNSHTP